MTDNYNDLYAQMDLVRQAANERRALREAKEQQEMEALRAAQTLLEKKPKIVKPS